MATLLINSVSMLLICVVCSFFSWLLYRSNRSVSGAGLWSLGTSLFSLSLVLVEVQKVAPLWFGIILTNHLFLTAMLLQLGGMLAFFQRKFQLIALLSGIFLFSLPFFYFTYLQPNVQTRIVIFSITYIIINSLILRTIIYYKDNRYQVAATLYYVAIGIGLTLMVYRLIRLFFFDLFSHDSFNSILVQLMNGMPFFVCCTMLLGFFLLCSERQYLYIQKLQQDALELVDKEKKLLAFLSHEFRTPLNAIVGKAQLLARQLDDPKAQYECELIAEAGQSLSMINQQILRQAEANHSNVPSATSDRIELRQWLQRFIDTYQHIAQSKGLTLNLFVTAKAPEKVMLDSTALRQVLTNLLSNAIKYSDSGTIRLSIEPTITQDSYRISVTDEGIGIPLHEQQKVLLPFGRAWHSLQQEGSGLGLALTQQLLHSMGTELAFTSNTGEGSCFYFILQLPPVTEPEQTIKANVPITPLHILVVEDILLNQQVMSGMLQYLSHNFSIASSLTQATALLQDKSFDLLLLDLNLPDGDGLSFFKQLKKTNPLLPDTCIVTANITLEIEQACLSAGVKAILHKPVDIEKLQQVITEAASAIQVFNCKQFWQLARFIPANAMQQQLALLDGEMMEILDKLRNADADTQNVLIHKLAGKSATLGMPKLTKICNALTQSNVEITHYLPQFRRLVDEAISALKQEVIKQSII